MIGKEKKIIKKRNEEALRTISWLEKQKKKTEKQREEDYPGVSSDTIMKQVPNCEKVSVETCEKLLKHENAAICFMSCTNIYEIEEAFEKLLIK